MKEHSLEVEDGTIIYYLVRKKVKNVNLRVRSDASVLVSAGQAVPHSFIEQVVRNKAAWILKNQRSFRERRESAAGRQYIAGEIIDYLGGQYPLQLYTVSGKGKVIFDGKTVVLHVKEESDPVRREKLLQKWYKEQARLIFQASLDRVYPLLGGQGIEKPLITVRDMKTRWGSCSWKKGKITLNTGLLKTPLACIDYVVLHELAHFRHHRHDSSFYNFLAAIMPDWRRRKKLLNTYSLELID